MAKKTRNNWVIIGISLWILATVLAIAPSWPHIYYRISPKASEALASTINQTVSNVPHLEPTPSQKPADQPVLPDFDPKLPEENGLIIDKIGVRGELHQGQDWQEILKNGLWIVPEFGTPENNQLPIIIAAHRWGYLSWSNAFRRLNSFYNLPKLEVGDKVDIVWNQRKYTYQITESKVGTEITNTEANLILYTCELWNSPTRIFKYGTRIN